MEILFPNTVLKQTVDLSISGNVDGFTLQKQIESICKHQLGPQLEKLLDKYDLSESVVGIDTITVEIGDFKVDELEFELSQRIISKLEDELIKHLIQPWNRENTSKLSVNEKIASAFIFYLKNGYFPWWAGISNSNDLYNKLDYFCRAELTQSCRRSFIETLKIKQARLRLQQLPNGYFCKLIDHISDKELLDTSKEIINLISVNHLKKSPERIYKQVVLQILIDSKSKETVEFYNTVLEQIKPGKKDFLTAFITTARSFQEHKILSEEIAEVLLSIENHYLQERPDNNFEAYLLPNADREVDLSNGGEYKTPKEDLSLPQDVHNDPGIYLNNAGLVIIAPFLPTFFKSLELSEGKILFDVRKAIALLNFMVSGNQYYEEFECVLPKVLCGVAVKESVEKAELSDNEKNKVNDLLLSVIEHWEILKNTSVLGLQSSFLQREGKLTFENGRWNLLINRQTFDVLLEHLPWSINVIKLPWMENMLVVEWV